MGTRLFSSKLCVGELREVDGEPGPSPGSSQAAPANSLPTHMELQVPLPGYRLQAESELRHVEEGNASSAAAEAALEALSGHVTSLLGVPPPQSPKGYSSPLSGHRACQLLTSPPAAPKGIFSPQDICTSCTPTAATFPPNIHTAAPHLFRVCAPVSPSSEGSPLQPVLESHRPLPTNTPGPSELPHFSP